MRHAASIVIALGILAVASAFDNVAANEKRTFVLPSDIAEMLRARNHDGRGGCPGESSIFVHGFHHLDARSKRIIFFLGAPDYLCHTNSFISVILDSDGVWTVGQQEEPSWAGHRMLVGAPTFFQYSSEFGFFVASELQVPGPGNLMYHSPDGVTWTSVDLPEAETKPAVGGCCFAPLIRRVCVAETGTLFVDYEESESFHPSVWSTLASEQAFPTSTHWSRASGVPDFTRCAETRHDTHFMPQSLRQKTADGALFDVTYDLAVLIPGPTR